MTPDRVAALQQTVGIPPGTFPERLAATGPDARAVYGVLLPAFAAAGRPPSPAALAAGAASRATQRGPRWLSWPPRTSSRSVPTATCSGRSRCRRSPTRHRVQVQGRPVLHAMCAVDALGIPAMLGAAGTVISNDPATGRPIEVRVAADGALDVRPPDAVVLLGRTGDGPLASACCSVIDFHADRRAAEDVLRGEGTRGAVLTVPEAHALGVLLFAALPAPD